MFEHFGVEKFMVEKSGIEKSGVEKSGVAKSGFEKSGALKVRGGSLELKIPGLKCPPTSYNHMIYNIV